ncbi:MAG: hypothetical protein AB7O38_15670, partial [Pirellulaceae bacterium]
KWSPQEKSQLVRTGRVKGYDGHHIKSVSSRSGDVSNPNNIRFVTRAEHHRLHGGNWKTPTYGKPIDRTRILNGRVSKM